MTAPTGPPPGSPPTRDARRGVVRAALLTIGVTAVVVVVGVGLSVLVAGLPSEGMRGLGYLVMGLLLTGLLALVGLVALSVVSMRRVLPPGRRLGPVLALVLTVLTTVGVAYAALEPLVLLAAIPLGTLAPVAVASLQR